MTDFRALWNPRMVRWLIVGVVFTGLGLLVIKLLAGVLEWPYAVATFCSGELCTILRFLIIDRWVFGHRRPTWSRLWQYHVGIAASFGVWWSAANLMRGIGMHYIWAAVVAMFLSVGVSVLSNFFWIWRSPPETAAGRTK